MKSTLDVIWRSYCALSVFTQRLRHAQEQDYGEVGSISAALSSPVYVLSQEIPEKRFVSNVFMYAFFVFPIFQPFMTLLACHISLDLSKSLETIIDDCRNFKALIFCGPITRL